MDNLTKANQFQVVVRNVIYGGGLPVLLVKQNSARVKLCVSSNEGFYIFTDNAGNVGAWHSSPYFPNVCFEFPFDYDLISRELYIAGNSTSQDFYVIEVLDNHGTLTGK